MKTISDFRVMIIRGIDTKVNSLNYLSSESSFDPVIKGYSFNFQNNVHEAFIHISKFRPHLIVVDDSVQDILNFKNIHFQYPSLLLLFLIDDEALFFNKIISFGIHGAIEKNSGIDELFLAIEKLQHQGVYVSSSLLSKILKSFERNYNSVLSARELHILKLLSLGYTNTKIASSIQLSSETVKVHMKNIYKKLNVNSKQEAISVGMKDKLI